MKKLSIIVIGITMLILWGCSKSTEPVVTDEQAIMEVIASYDGNQNEDYFYSNLDDESENGFLKPSAESFLAKPIVPIKFGRVGISPVVRDINIVFTSDTTAKAYYRTILRGKFVILAEDENPEDTIYVQRIAKKMGHVFERVAWFVKRGKDNDRPKDRWKLVAFSMAKGQSLGVVDTNLVRTTLEIKKVVLEADSVIEIDDPLTFVQVRPNVFNFTSMEQVKVTVYVKNTTLNPVVFPQGMGTELVRLHQARHRWNRKHGIGNLTWVRQEVDGTNVYEGIWTVGIANGVHHACIDVIDNGTILDDDAETYPYNSVTWGTPYKVRMGDMQGN